MKPFDHHKHVRNLRAAREALAQGQNSVQRSHKQALGTSVPKHGLVANLCYIVTKRYPSKEVLVEAELDKLAAVAEWRRYWMR